MITLIIPIRLSDHALYDEIERLERISEKVPRDFYSIMIVDYGTGPSRQPDLMAFAARHPDVEIVRGGSPDIPFSIGEARDIGVAAAKNPIVMFNDMDFICETETYIDIAEEASYRKYEHQGYDFMCVPTIFLTEQGTEKYLSLMKEGRRRDAGRFAHSEALNSNRNEYVEHYALGSSALVINRYFYLASGGHDRSFKGHGAEDFEFYNRLTNLAPLAARPPKYNDNISFVSGNWEGFRSYFALYGMHLWMRGGCLVHLHHPRRELVDASYKKSAQNFKILANRLKSFRSEDGHLPPLPEPGVTAKTLVLVKPHSKPAQSLRYVLPLLGEYDFSDETFFADAGALIDYLSEMGYSRVLFLNPYGNSHRLDLYDGLRAEGIECIAFDRGALNDSWFFDRGGFLGNSSSYDEAMWNKPLTPAQDGAIKEWIDNYIEDGQTLEKNGQRVAPEEWRRRLGIGRRKAIFVALQRPGDTATRFFCGPSESYDNYLKWIGKLCEDIDPARYVVLVKKHPLETETPDFDSAIFLPDDAHVHDIIALSDKVVVLNSGVGVLSIMMQKPVIVCGNAFYAVGGLAHQADSFETLLSLAGRPLTCDGEASRRFIAYLKDEFYSFGQSFYVDLKDQNGDNIRICNKILFSSIRGLSSHKVELGQPLEWIKPASFLFRGVTSPVSMVRPNKKGAPAPEAAPKNPTIKQHEISMAVLKRNPALFIYRVSRNIPIFRTIVDVIEPLYEKSKVKRPPLLRSSSLK